MIRGDLITLGQLLKVIGVIDWGGEAKIYLYNNPVYVNGELDDRRGRKIRVGDVVDLPGGRIIHICGETPAES